MNVLQGIVESMHALSKVVTYLNNKQFFLFAAFLSGVFGIIYEVLFTRAINAYIGDTYYVIGVVLLTFFTALGIGSCVAHRLARYLGIIELVTGIYAIAFTFLFWHNGFSILEWLVALPIPHEISLSVTTILLLIPIAFLVGLSVPIFALYCSEAKNTFVEKNFALVYFFYNFGAAFSILLAEFFIIRHFGITAAFLSVAICNILLGVWLLWIYDSTKRNALVKVIETQQKKGHIPLLSSYSYSLFILAIASGAYQFYSLNLTQRIFGPLNENFAVVLSVALIGITVAFLVFHFFKKISFEQWVFWGIFSLPIFFLLIGPIIDLWVLWVVTIVVQTSHFYLLGKILFATLLLLPPFVFFGGTVQAFISGTSIGKHIKAPGFALGVTSFGNALGVLISIFILHTFFSAELFSFVLLFISFIGIAFFSYKRLLICILITLPLTLIAYAYWPTKELGVGYKTILYSHFNTMDLEERISSVDEFRNRGETTRIINFSDGSTGLGINGYISIVIQPISDFSGAAGENLEEGIIGLHPGLYAKRYDRALVIGYGSGTTAGFASAVYDSVDIAEINPSVFDVNPSIFSVSNLNILSSGRANIFIEDGIVTLARDNGLYDAIIITVPPATYFSSGKLWTLEFFEKAKENLTEGGTVTGWIDRRVGVENAQVQINTIFKAFNYCSFLFLNRGYYTYTCSDNPLVRNSTLDERLAINGIGWFNRILQDHLSF